MRDSLMTRWSEVGDKLVQLAEEFPAERYDFRPVPEVRSFAEQLRHLAFWNLYVAQKLRREEAHGDANELPATTHPSRAEIVPTLRESQLVVYFRLNGLVPPASR
jgi:hypothetical protein